MTTSKILEGERRAVTAWFRSSVEGFPALDSYEYLYVTPAGKVYVATLLPSWDEKRQRLRCSLEVPLGEMQGFNPQSPPLALVFTLSSLRSRWWHVLFRWAKHITLTIKERQYQKRMAKASASRNAAVQGSRSSLFLPRGD